MFKKREKIEEGTVIFEDRDNPQVRLREEKSYEEIKSSRELFPRDPDPKQLEAAEKQKNTKKDVDTTKQTLLSKEERAARDGVSERSKKGITTIIARNYVNNPDLKYLLLVILAIFTASFFIAKLYYGLNVSQIKTTMEDYFTVLGAFILAIFGLFNKTINGEGSLSKGIRLGWKRWRSKEVEKTNLDAYGRTIVEEE